MVYVSRSSAILSFLFALQTGTITHVLAAGQQCYWRNGTQAPSWHKPCKPQDPNSACCNLEKKNDAPADICMDNGLCLALDGVDSGMTYQLSCTDQSWQSTLCPSICNRLKAKGIGYSIIPCRGNGTGQWCCSHYGENCCASASSITMSPMLTSTLPTSMPPTSTSINTDGSEQCEECEYSKITAVGAGVGVSLGTCLLAAVAGLIFQYFMHKKRLQGVKDELALRMAGAQPMQYSPGMTLVPPSELESNEQPVVHELGPQRH